MLYPPPDPRHGAHWAEMRVGLLGGTFDPPHDGHLHASLTALRTLDLDCVWWLVTPQNPLKPPATQDADGRLASCRAITAPHPRLIVSDIESRLRTCLTWQTIRALNIHFPRTSFVWITGMDNARTMHRWHNWRYIPDHVATAHVARPPADALIRACPLRHIAGRQHHTTLSRPLRAALCPCHTYWILQNAMVNTSSTALRQEAENSAT